MPFEFLHRNDFESLDELRAYAKEHMRKVNRQEIHEALDKLLDGFDDDKEGYIYLSTNKGTFLHGLSIDVAFGIARSLAEQPEEIFKTVQDMYRDIKNTNDGEALMKSWLGLN